MCLQNRPFLVDPSRLVNSIREVLGVVSLIPLTDAENQVTHIRFESKDVAMSAAHPHGLGLN